MRAPIPTPAQCVDRARYALTSPGVRIVVFFLFPYAALLVGLDVAARYGEVTDQHLPVEFFLSQDRSFGEYLEYALMLSMAAMLLISGSRHSRKVYTIFGTLFLVLSADNALELHEQLGDLFAVLMPATPGLAPHHVAESVVFACVGSILAAGLAIGFLDADATSLIDAAILTTLVAVIAFFGVAVDALTAMDNNTLAETQVLAFIEDGGEFATIIVTFLTVIGIFERERQFTRPPAINAATTGKRLVAPPPAS